MARPRRKHARPVSLPGTLLSLQARLMTNPPVSLILHPPIYNPATHRRIVQSLATTLLDHKIVVLAYNSRGTGGSTGKASWTGEAEKKDYASVVEWFLMHETNRDGFVGEDHHTVYCCVSSS